MWRPLSNWVGFHFKPAGTGQSWNGLAPAGCKKSWDVNEMKGISLDIWAKNVYVCKYVHNWIYDNVLVFTGTKKYYNNMAGNGACNGKILDK